MNKGGINNLGILAEVEDEEDALGRFEEIESDDETESDGDDEADEGVRRGEPNKFDGLCDGVLNAMALVHEALQDLLELKDGMLQHSLPPTLLIQLTMVSGRVFRSISDLGMPVGELVRLVRVYSTPWEEKSTALKKLHEDHERKQRQLNIAIRRLKLVDSSSMRVAKEKRIMNWEKLFSKMTSAKGHGRRWKFLIETIKQKAKLGLEHVQAYTQGLEESSESEEEEPAAQAFPTEDGEEAEEKEESEGLNATEDTEGDEEENREEKEDVEEGEPRGGEIEGTDSRASTGDSEGDNSDDIPCVTVHIGPGDDVDIEGRVSRSASPKKVRFEESFAKPMTIRPPMKDADAWTGEPDYDRSLFIRIFCPEGLDKSELRCSLSYNGNMLKTPLLDIQEEEVSDGSLPDVGEEKPSKRPRAARKGEERSDPDATQSEPKSGKEKPKRFFEYEIQLPDEIKDGLLLLGEKPPPEPENIRIAVHQGQFEEIIAMATIDFSDIKELALETVILAPPHGDDDVAAGKSRSNSLSAVSSLGDAESLSDSMDIPIMMDEPPEHLAASTPRDDPVRGSEPLPFPLYSLHAGKSDAVHMPCGNVPLLMYWAKRARPLHFNRQCGTLGVYDLVYDITGINMNTTSKEDLHKEMVDEALSVIAATPDTQEWKADTQDKQTSIEETVLKSEYDKMIEMHQEEMTYLQEEYEKRLQDLMNNLQDMQNTNAQLSKLPTQRPISVASRVSTTPGAMTPVTAKRSERSDPSHYTGVASERAGILSQQSLRPVSRVKTMSDVDGEKAFITNSTPIQRIGPLPPRTQKPVKNFRIGRPLPKWGEHLPQDFLDRLQLWEEERRQHKQELNEKTLKDIKDNLEKKLAGQHKLSKREEQIYDALKDVSLPALFMPYKSGNIYNPRAHQYFHPTGTTDVRLTQPPSVFQLPPLPDSKLSVVNLFELSKNFHNRGPAWLVERYIQQQQPLNDGGYPQTPAPTSAHPQVTTISEQTPFNDNLDSPTSQRSIPREREVES